MNSTNIAHSARQGISYADAPAVLAGLARMREDLADLAAELDPAMQAVTHATQSPEDKARALRALQTQQAQLVWLAADTGAMLAALAPTEEKAMPIPHSQHRKPSPILQLYRLAASLNHLGATLPEEQGGLALLLSMIGAEISHCAESLDEADA